MKYTKSWFHKSIEITPNEIGEIFLNVIPAIPHKQTRNHIGKFMLALLRTKLVKNEKS